MKNLNHSYNIFILKMLIREYNILLNEIKLQKKKIKELYESINNLRGSDSCNFALMKVYFILLKRRRKEINIVANAIKVQKANIKRSNNK